MLLIDLPPELLQLILLYSSTPSFVQLIRTCHTLFDLAAQSQYVIAHHLNNVSMGRPLLPCGTVSTREMFLIFRRRAAASLQGVSITADRCDYYFPTASVNVPASCLTSIKGLKIALAQRAASHVQVYEMSQGRLKLRAVFDPSSNDESTFRPLQTAFDELNNMYVLFSIEEGGRKFPNPTHPCRESSSRDRTTRASLTRVRLSALPRGHDSWDIDEMISGYLRKDAKPVRPVSMAARGGYKVSIAWESGVRINHAKNTSVSLYTLLEDGEVHSLCAHDIEKQYLDLRVAPPYDSSYAPSSVAFTKDKTAINCYSAGLASPICHVEFKIAGASEVTVRSISVPIDDRSGAEFLVQDPFFAYHESVKRHKDTSSRSCRDVKLCFATQMRHRNRRTIDGCILSSSTTAGEDNCFHQTNPDHPHPSAFHPRTHIVARLWGFKLPNTKLAAAMAFAEQGNRIAIASWDKIFVWPLQPKALVHTHIRDQVNNAKYEPKFNCHLVELKPIVLKADAVVHKMTFTASENELVTITDRGLQMWNLGPSAVGRRTVNLLYE